jgi:antitoxin FitA
MWVSDRRPHPRVIHRIAQLLPSPSSLVRLFGMTAYMQNVLILLYNAFMGSLLQIRDVPDELRRALKARAAARGQSLNRYVLDLLARDVQRFTVAEVLDRAARRSEQATGSSVDLIRESREERGRELLSRLS